MKIYFAGSICGGRADADLYAKLVNELKEYGTVLTEHVGNVNLISKESEMTSKMIHDRDIEWLTESDVLIAEVTQVSLGVGYEIGRAVTMNKPIYCLYRPSEGKRLSCMIEGAVNDTNFSLVKYKPEEFRTVFKDIFANLNKK